MKFSRLSLLCLLLSGTSAITTSAMADQLKDYLADNGNAAPFQSYGLMDTPKGIAVAQAHQSGGYTRLGAVSFLVKSHNQILREAVIEGKGKDAVSLDKTLAHRTMDPLSVATHLVSGKDIKVVGKGTAETNKCYFELTTTKGANLAARLAVVKDPSVIHMLRKEFDFNNEGKIKTEDDLKLNPEETHRLQLHALTYYAYNAISPGSGNAFDQLKTTYREFATTLGHLERFVTQHSATLFAPLIAVFKAGSTSTTLSMYDKMQAIYSADQKQQYFEIADDGLMRSAPRCFYFSTNTGNPNVEPNAHPNTQIYKATRRSHFSGGTLMGGNKLDIALHGAGFIMRRFEEQQSALVVTAIRRQQNHTNPDTSGITDPATIARDILIGLSTYAENMKPHTTERQAGSAISDIFLRYARVLYLAPKTEGKASGGGDKGTKGEKPKTGTASIVSTPTSPPSGALPGGLQPPSSPPPPTTSVNTGGASGETPTGTSPVKAPAKGLLGFGGAFMGL